MNFVFISPHFPHTYWQFCQWLSKNGVRVLANIKAILAEAGLNMSNVVKTTVFLADMNDFADMNAVYAEFFTEPYPARSAVAVKTLPKGALVEIEVVAAI